MTFEEVRDLQISNIIANASEMKHLTKQCLSIMDSSTAKDDEIVMWINSAVSDMINRGIDVANNLSDGLIQGAIVMHVKSKFGMCDINEKTQAEKAYENICTNLSLSARYRLEEVIE